MRPRYTKEEIFADELNNNEPCVLESPSPDSIAGVAAAAATAATVFMDKRRSKCCGKCCGKKSKHNAFID